MYPDALGFAPVLNLEDSQDTQNCYDTTYKPKVSQIPQLLFEISKIGKESEHAEEE